MKLPSIAEVRKFIAAAVGVLAEAVAFGFLHGALLHYAGIIIAAAAALGVYVVPNAQPAPAGEHEA
jgi:uncharacterized membrane protein YdjX (TVP38/TMEM64 family)